MNTVLYFSANGAIYETSAFSKADIDQLIREQRLESLTSADRSLDFWFSPTTPGCQRRVNRNATELLLSSSDFTAKTVPLLRGAVVVATHDADGDLDGLSWGQLDALAARMRALGKRDARLLERRVTRDDRQLRRAAETAAPVLVSCARPRTPVRH